MPPVDPHVALLDDARHAEAVAARTHRRLLSEADDTDATFAGTLAAVAESGAVVVLDTTVGRALRGRIATLTATHARCVGEHGEAWVRLDAVTVVRLAPDEPLRATATDRIASPVPLSVALGPVVEHRGLLDVVLAGGATARGVAVAVGADVLTLRNTVTGSRDVVPLDRALVVTVHAG